MRELTQTDRLGLAAHAHHRTNLAVPEASNQRLTKQSWKGILPDARALWSKVPAEDLAKVNGSDHPTGDPGEVLRLISKYISRIQRVNGAWVAIGSNGRACLGATLPIAVCNAVAEAD